jgi:hypothetical protein
MASVVSSIVLHQHHWYWDPKKRERKHSSMDTTCHRWSLNKGHKPDCSLH